MGANPIFAMIYYDYYCTTSSTHLALHDWTAPRGKLAEVGAPDSRGGYMVVLFTKDNETSHVHPVCCPECCALIHRVAVSFCFGYPRLGPHPLLARG